MKLDKIQNILSQITASAASLIKVVAMSRGIPPEEPVKTGKSIVIMGNGPSLRQTIDKDAIWLCSNDLMAVNFAANTPDFFNLRPGYYILADGHFFSGNATDPNVEALWKNLASVSWGMTLLVPRKFRHFAKALILTNRNIKLKTFNLTPVEGFRLLTHMLFNAGLGMPRPRNVMIPAIMMAIREGYRDIYLCGADHTWTQTLSVDEDNYVVSIQPHFYQDNDKEHERVRSTYKGLRLHDVLGSMTIAFKSYWQVAAYACSKKVNIINATPGSMIDAFKRRKSL